MLGRLVSKVSHGLELPATSGLFSLALLVFLMAVAAAITFERRSVSGEPEALVVDPPMVTFLELDQSVAFQVKGMFPGGKIRPLPKGMRAGLSFTSDAPAVVSVTQEGQARALANGGADIEVTAGHLTARVPAIVALPAVTVPAPDPQKMFPLGTDGTAVVLNRVVIVGAKGHDPRMIDSLARRTNSRVVAGFGSLGAYLLEIQADSPEALIRFVGTLEQDPAVGFAIPDIIMPTARDDRRATDTAQLDDDVKTAYTEIGTERAWELLEEHLLLPSPVTVAVIDSALDFSLDPVRAEFDQAHVVVREMVQGLTVTDRAARAKHGSAVSSIIAAENQGVNTTSNRQLSGLLPSVRKLPYRVLFYQVGVPDIKGDWRGIDLAAVYAALDDIQTKSGQVDIVNMSFGMCSPDIAEGVGRSLVELLCRANLFVGDVLRGESYGFFIDQMPRVLFVAAAGNENAEADAIMPGSLSERPNLVTVGATDGDERAWFSNYGSKVTLGAPGVDVWTVSTVALGGYDAVSGTSFSSPLTAGVAGLVRSVSPELGPEAVKALLRDTGRKIDICTDDSTPCPGGKTERWRLLQADKAVEKALRNAGLFHERVALVGSVPGKFTTTEATFTLSVSPKDEKGRLVQSGVSESNFSFRDVTASLASAPGEVVSNATVRVVDVDVVAPRSAKDKTVALVLDSSGSMTDNDPRRLRVEAAAKLISLLKGKDKAAVLDFGAGADVGRRAARLLQDVTADKTLLTAALGQVSESGRTPLFDGLLDAMDIISGGATTNATVVVLTDGEENASKSAFDDVVQQALALGVPVFTVGLGPEADTAGLQALAGETGGTYASAADAEALNGVFRSIGFGIVEGRVVVTGQGAFHATLPSDGDYLISGTLETKLGKETFQTLFSFTVRIR